MSYQISTNINEPKTLKVYDNGARATVICRMLRPGKFTSGVNGVTFNITNEHLIKARNHYNNKLMEYVKDIFRKPLTENELQEVQMSPVGAEHEIHQDAIKGRIIGKTWIDEDKGVNWLYATLEILGEENVKKVQNGIYKSTSINFNTETGEITELSFVFMPAISDSCILSGANNNMSVLNDALIKMQATTSKIDEQNKIIDNSYNEVAQLRAEIDNLNLRVNFADRLQGLVKSGKISRAEMKRTLSTLPNVANQAALKSVIAAFSGLGVRAKRGRYYSSDESFFKELIMGGESKINPNAIAEMAERVKAKLSGKPVATTQNQTAQFAAQQTTNTVALKDTPEYQTMKAHLQAKGDIEGLKAHCAMGGETYEPEPELMVPASESAAFKAKIVELETTLAEKEEKIKSLKDERVELKAELKAQTAVVNSYTAAFAAVNQGAK